METNDYVYFLYSEEQIKEKNKILKKMAKQFQPGVVVVNGVRKYYTVKSNKSTLDRFYDVKVVAEGYDKNFVQEKPQEVEIGGN